MEKSVWRPWSKRGGWRCEEEHDEAISFVRLPRRKAPRNGEVGGSSRRERYSVPGTAPLGKRSVVSFHFAELILHVTVLEMLPRACVLI